MTETFPTLYKYTSKGAVQTWQISVNDNVITTVHGQLDGKKQTNHDAVLLGKNVGKANATTPAEQASSEAKSQWTKKQDRQGYKLHDDFYSDAVEDISKKKVMLAHKYSEHADKMPDPCYGQPKLDGVRGKAVIIDGTCIIYSRTDTIITGVPHINRYLEHYFPQGTVVLDGEMYNHNYRDKFEELISFIRQETPKVGHEVVQYHIYDVMNDDVYSKRLEWLKENVPLLMRVITTKLHGPEEIERYFRGCLEHGYEGAMLRDPNGKYEHKRSYGLQKVKEMDDAEYLIVSVSEGRGKMKGAANFVCSVPNTDDTFDCAYKGTYAERQHVFTHSHEYIGKQLVVQYQGLTKYGIPRFPVGLRVREDV